MGFFSKFKEGLAKTRDALMGKVEQIITFGRKIDEEFYEELEEALIMADVGVNTVMEIMDELRSEVKKQKLSDAEELKPVLKRILADLMGEESTGLKMAADGLTIILFVGVNGVGKTTTI